MTQKIPAPSPIVPQTKARFMLLVDHVDVTSSNKLVLVGTFDHYFTREQDGEPLIGRGGVLVAKLDSSLANGIQQSFLLRCLTEDEKEVYRLPIELTFSPSGEGAPWSAMLKVDIAGLKLPRFGAYRWVLSSGEREIAECPFAVFKLPEEHSNA